jgi:uracil-DNA glycosylase
MMRANNRLVQPDMYEHINQLPPVWQSVLSQAALAPVIKAISGFLAARLNEGATIYPAEPFRALQGLTPADTKVVILGQDPYHGPNQAQGLAFSVPDEEKCPPSLRNIFKEIQRDFSSTLSTNDLTRWVEQGVFLLNTVLTVQDAQPASHAKLGWQTITDAIIANLAAHPSPKVFMLWGAHAQNKAALISQCQPAHLILTANHPSPLSAMRPPAPFIGCGHFVKANQWLQERSMNPIDW